MMIRIRLKFFNLENFSGTIWGDYFFPQLFLLLLLSSLKKFKKNFICLLERFCKSKIFQKLKIYFICKTILERLRIVALN